MEKEKEKWGLKKKSWHMWIMTYVWGWTYKDFTHMCPYFWINLPTVIFLFIPKFIIKEGFGWSGKGLSFVGKYIWQAFCYIGGKLETLFTFIGDWYDDITEAKRLRREEAKAIAKAEEKVRLKELMERIKANGVNKYIEEVGGKIDDKVRNFFVCNDYNLYNQILDGITQFNYRKEQDRDERLKKRAAAMEALRESLWGQRTDEPMNKAKEKSWLEIEAEREKQRIIRNKARISKIYRIAQPIMKWIAYITAGAIALVTLYYFCLFAPYAWKGIVGVIKGVGHFFVWTGEGFASVKHKTWIGGFTVMGIIAIGFILVIFILYIARYCHSHNIKFPRIFPKKEYIPYCNRRSTKFKRWWGVYIGYPIILVFKAIGRFFALIGTLIWTLICMIGSIFAAIGNGFNKVRRFIYLIYKKECPAIEWKD